jgi:hypothetical protein
VPWTTGWVAEYINLRIPVAKVETNGEVTEKVEEGEEEKAEENGGGEELWTAEKVVGISREIARMVYGISFRFRFDLELENGDGR